MLYQTQVEFDYRFKSGHEKRNNKLFCKKHRVHENSKFYVFHEHNGNLKKYMGIQLAGGVQLNGDAIYQEAQQEIQALEDELVNNLPPSCFFIGYVTPYGMILSMLI